MSGAGVQPRRVAAPGFQAQPAPSFGTQQLGEAATQLGAAMLQAEDQGNLVKNRLDFTTRMDDLRAKYRTDPDPATAAKRFAQEARDMATPYYDNLRTPDAKNSFALDSGHMIESARVALDDLAFQNLRDTTKSSLDAQGEDFSRKAALAANDAEGEGYITQFSKSVMGAADSGLITHEEAGRRVQVFGEKLALYRGRRLVETDPVAAKKQLENPDFLPNLDPLARVELQVHADTQIKQREREARAAQAEARTTGALALSDLDSVIASGLPVAPSVVDAARNAVRAGGDARQIVHLEHSIRAAGAADGMRGMTRREMEGQLATWQDQAAQNGADATLAAQVTGGRKLLATMTTRLGQDVLGWASDQGVIRLSPLALTGQDSPQAWQARIHGAEAAARHYEVQPQFLTAAEGAAVKAGLSPGADANTKQQLLKTLVGGLGSRAVPELTRLGVNPALVTAGGLLNAGPAHARVASDIVAGEAALASTVRGGDGQSILRPTDAARAASVAGRSSFLGGVRLPQGFPQLAAATALLPGEAARISAAADALYAARASSQGLTGKDAALNGNELYERGLQESAGARFEGDVQFGGMSHYNGRPVIVPATITADSFEGLVRHLTADDLAVASVTGAPPLGRNGKYAGAELLRSGYLVTLGDGKFGISTTDPGTEISLVRDARGAIYRLDFGQALTRLQARAAK